MKKFTAFILMLLLISPLSQAYSFEQQRSSYPSIDQILIIEHSGRTDRNGCHMDRKTGVRHCH